jgi:hypothetical protein
MQNALATIISEVNKTQSGSHEYWSPADVLSTNTIAGLIINKGGLP